MAEAALMTELEDPYSDGPPLEESAAMWQRVEVPAWYRVGYRVMHPLNYFESSDPCEEQRIGANYSTGAMLVILAVSVIAVATMPVSAPAATVIATISGATGGFATALMGVAYAHGAFARCKADNPTTYPRRP